MTRSTVNPLDVPYWLHLCKFRGYVQGSFEAFDLETTKTYAWAVLVDDSPMAYRMSIGHLLGTSLLWPETHILLSCLVAWLLGT